MDTSQLRGIAVTSVVVGAGATAVMDVTGELIRRTTGVPLLDLGLVGRWIGHLRNGRFAHASIMRAEPVEHERAIGWAAHYAIGVAFAAPLVAVPSWRREPTLLPALAAGLATTAAPWFLMQPAFGIGVAASKTPDPTTARLRSLRAHAAYGAGLYLAARAVRALRG